MTPSLDTLCGQVAEVAKEAGQFIASERQQFDLGKVEVKSLNSLVSYVDREAEEIIVKALKKLLPEAGFITEEETVTSDKKGEYTWVIDPLDGTTNFIHGIPCFCVSIALLHHTEPVVGVVYEINLQETFTAWKDGPARLNGKDIQVSRTLSLDNALLATGFPYYDYGRMGPYMQLFTRLMQSSRGLRRLGSAATDLAYVAAGRFDAFYEYGLNPWDVAAGILIVKQAGGRVTDFSGGDDSLFGKEIIASNSAVHHELTGAVQACFGTLDDTNA